MTVHSSVTTKQPFFGWFLVVAGFAMMATCYTVMVSGMALFQPHIVADLGITIGTYNTANSLSTLVSIVGALVIGHVVDRVPGRLLGGATVGITVAALVGFSYLNEVWQLFALFAIDGLVVIAGTRLLISIVITNWFTAKQGFAVALALSGSGFGGALLSPVVSSLIGQYGWRTAFLALALICFIVSFPITVAVFYTRPTDRGLLPYGSSADKNADAASSHGPTTSANNSAKSLHDQPIDIAIGWKKVRNHPSFLLVVAGFAVMGILNGAAIPNSITNLTAVTVEGTQVVTGGHTPAWASMIYSYNMMVVLVAKIATGVVYDRFGVRVGIIVGSVACALGSLGMCFPATDIGPFVAATFFGFGTCMGTVAPSLVAIRLFGKKDMGQITGWITSVQMLGYAVGTILSGMVFDAFISFIPMWIASVAAAGVMLALLLAAEPLAHALVERMRSQTSAA